MKLYAMAFAFMLTGIGAADAVTPVKAGVAVEGFRPRSAKPRFALLPGSCAALAGYGLLFALTAPVWGMSDSALVALKQAGLGDSVITVVAREKVIETAAFTVDELVALKQAGMTDETIVILVTERSFMRRAQPVVYGRAVKPLNLASVEDLIELKRSGLSDEAIEAVILASSQRRGEDYDRAWKMLDRLGIEVEVHP